MIVNIEVQFKALADLVGIQVGKGSLLKDAQNIGIDPVPEGGINYFENPMPLKHVGGKLRVRLFRVDHLPKSMQHGQKIYVRVISGQRSRYGNKLVKCKDAASTGGDANQHHTKEVVT